MAEPYYRLPARDVLFMIYQPSEGGGSQQELLPDETGDLLGTIGAACDVLDRIDKEVSAQLKG